MFDSKNIFDQKEITKKELAKEIGASIDPNTGWLFIPVPVKIKETFIDPTTGWLTIPIKK
jgi:hypothetical protein